jgi:hypothetical protein
MQSLKGRAWEREEPSRRRRRRRRHAGLFRLFNHVLQGGRALREGTPREHPSERMSGSKHLLKVNHPRRLLATVLPVFQRVDVAHPRQQLSRYNQTNGTIDFNTT